MKSIRAIRVWILFLAPLQLVISCAAPEQPVAFNEKDPARFVSAFYAVEGKPGRVAAKYLQAEYQPWLSPDLYELLVKAENAPSKPDEVPPLNFDPFTSSQEAPELVKVEPVSSEKLNAVVRVWTKVKGDAEPDSFSVFLRVFKGHWTISDLEFGQQEKWRLVKFLKESY